VTVQRTENQPTGNGRAKVTDAAGASQLLKARRTKLLDPQEAATAAAIRKDAQEAAAREAMRTGKLGASTEAAESKSPTPPAASRAAVAENVEIDDVPITTPGEWDGLEVEISTQGTSASLTDPRASTFLQFVDQKARVTLELKDGTFSIPVITYKITTMSLFLFLPLAADTVGFVPKTGSHIRVGIDSRVIEVVYLGAYIEMEDMGFAIMTLYREDTQKMAEEAAASRHQSQFEDDPTIRGLRS
jgi:hypothetical protein